MSNVAASDRLHRLEQLVPLCESIRKGGEYRAALAHAASEVRKAAALPGRLEGLDSAMQLLHGTQHLSPKELNVDLEKLEAAGHAVEQSVNTDALKDVRFSVKEILESVQRVEAQTSKAWDALVQADFGPLQRLGAVLSEIPDTRVKGLELQKWATRVLDVASAGLMADSVKQFHETRAERAARLEGLGKLGIDAPVQSFLLEVANKRATLARVTPEVLEWLRAKNAHSRFRVELI